MPEVEQPRVRLGEKDGPTRAGDDVVLRVEDHRAQRPFGTTVAQRLIHDLLPKRRNRPLPHDRHEAIAVLPVRSQARPARLNRQRRFERVAERLGREVKLGTKLHESLAILLARQWRGIGDVVCRVLLRRERVLDGALEPLLGGLDIFVVLEVREQRLGEDLVGDDAILDASGCASSAPCRGSAWRRRRCCRSERRGRRAPDRGGRGVRCAAPSSPGSTGCPSGAATGKSAAGSSLRRPRRWRAGCAPSCWRH